MFLLSNICCIMDSELSIVIDSVNRLSHMTDIYNHFSW